jgi:site-specific DNA-methyltransferase (adenine-specific)
MNIFNNDCLEEMKNIEDKSIDLIFTDLPYGQTSCKWDSLIDLDLMWKQFKRIRKDTTPIIFTCSTKFGYSLIESNKKEFRYDLVWIKSSPVGFLNSKRMPMKKHEMVYIFYKKCPTETYGNNIKKYHKHKYLDIERNTKDKNGNVYETDNNKKIMESKYEPSLPNSIIKEDIGQKGEVYGKLPKNGACERLYTPPLPNSIIKEEKKENPPVVIESDSELYGKIKRTTFKHRQDPNYEPPLPNSILEISSQKGKHSTQKPTQLSDFFIKYYSNENDLVLDCCMGSGSTGISCKNLKRKFIGIEKDKDIFNIAKDRLFST